MQQGPPPVPRNYFDLSINLHCDLPDVYRINNNVDAAVQAVFPMTPWSQTYMLIYVEKYLNNSWQICDASKKTVFKSYKGSLHSDMQPSQPPVVLEISDSNETLILRSNVSAYQIHHVRFQMDIPKTNHGFKRGTNAQFRLVFVLLEEVWPVNGQLQLVTLQTKYSSVFDVINGGKNDNYVRHGMPTADNNIFHPINVPMPANTPNYLTNLVTDYDYLDFDLLPSESDGFGNSDNLDFLQSDVMLTNEHKPNVNAYNPLLDSNNDDIVAQMSKLVLDQTAKKEEEQIAKLLRDGFKFVVRRRDQNRPAPQNAGPSTNAAGDDIPKQIPVPVLKNGEAIEIILTNNLDDTCGFSVSGAVHSPGVESLEFESPNGKAERDGTYYVVPKGSFVYSSVIANNSADENQDVITLTLVTKITMDNDKSDKFFMFKRRVIVDE
jgi:hypothetical protein